MSAPPISTAELEQIRDGNYIFSGWSIRLENGDKIAPSLLARMVLDERARCEALAREAAKVAHGQQITPTVAGISAWHQVEDFVEILADAIRDGEAAK